MDALNLVLQCWQECKPDGIALRLDRLRQLQPTRQGKLRDMLSYLLANEAVEGVPLRWRLESPDSPSFVLFVHFLWAEHIVSGSELFTSKKSFQSQVASEQFAEELAVFNDYLFGSISEKGVNYASLIQCLRIAKSDSMDQDAWEMLEKAASPFCTKNCDTSQIWLKLDELSSLLLLWLTELAEEYCQGPRAAAVLSVRRVCGCSRSEAVQRLGACGWDEELALRAALDERCEGDVPWSSMGAKLRRSEVECSICSEDYAEGWVRSTTPCCFQAMCTSCEDAITSRHLGRFHCPFCRVATSMPDQRSTSRRQRSQRRNREPRSVDEFLRPPSAERQPSSMDGVFHSMSVLSAGLGRRAAWAVRRGRARAS